MELLIVVAIIGILAAISIPQYARYRRNAQDAAAKDAAHHVAIAQEGHFIVKSSYTTSYASLVADGGLRINYDILYGPIAVTVITDPPSYSFSLNHKAEGTKTFTYTSEGSTTLLETPVRVTANDPSVPINNPVP